MGPSWRAVVTYWSRWAASGTAVSTGTAAARKRERNLARTRAPLGAFLEQLERALEARHGGVEIRLADEVELPEELHGVTDVLGGRLDPAAPHPATPSLQRAAPLGPEPAVHQPAALAGLAHDHAPARGSAPVDAASAIRKQTSGRQGPANLVEKDEPREPAAIGPPAAARSKTDCRDRPRTPRPSFRPSAPSPCARSRARSRCRGTRCRGAAARTRGRSARGARARCRCRCPRPTRALAHRAPPP